MMYYRLIRPNWGKKQLRKNRGNQVIWTDNPDFVREVEGPDTIEGFLDSNVVEQRNQQGYNVYFFPNYPSSVPEGVKFVSGKYVDRWEWVFIDFDLKDKAYESIEAFLEELRKFEVLPTKAVRSGNGCHVYWRVEDLDRDTYLVLQNQLIQKFKTDPSVWTCLQLMRVPNSLNTKDPNNFKKVELIPEFSSGNSYKVKDLFIHLPEITKDNLHKIQLHIMKMEGVYTPDVDRPEALVDELPPKFLDLMEQEEYIRNLFEKPEETYGDRSSADMALCNLLFNYDFKREEALQILFNTEKARTRAGAQRTTYAATCVDKVYGDRSVHAALSAKELKAQGDVVDLGDPVKGPEFMDCLGYRWRKQQILGLIAPPGTGKTSMSLKLLREFIVNNPDNDDIFLFYSLEMSAGQILNRWDTLTQGIPGADERLHVATNWAADGKRRYINLQDLILIGKDTIKRTGKKIGAVVIDHLAMVNPIIDTKRVPNFGYKESSYNGRSKSQVTLDIRQTCLALSEVAQTLDCFLIVQSQTTKERAGAGDKPLEMNAAYGSAAFEWIADLIITCWQPLLKVYDQTPLRVMAWSYAKIREIRPEDPVQRGQANLLHYDMANGNMRRLINEEYSEALTWLSKIEEMHREASKKGGRLSMTYSNSPEFARMELILGAKHAGS